MPFATFANVTSVANLISNLVAFATGAPSASVVGGWTSGVSSGDGSTILNQGTQIIGLLASTTISATAAATGGSETGILAFPGSGTVNLANNYDGQPNAPIAATVPNSAVVPRTRIITGAPNFPNQWLFGSTNAGRYYIHMVVEVSTDRFVHMSFGKMDPLITPQSGDLEYLCAGRHSEALSQTFAFPFFDSNGVTTQEVGMYILAELDTFGSPTWLRNYAQTMTSSTVGQGGGSNLINSFAGMAANTFNQRTPLFPLIPVHPRPVTSTSAVRQSPIGAFADVRYISVQNFAPKDTITLGGDTWHVFPALQKGIAWPYVTGTGPNRTIDSGFMGVAYRETGAD